MVYDRITLNELTSVRVGFHLLLRRVFIISKPKTFVKRIQGFNEMCCFS